MPIARRDRQQVAEERVGPVVDTEGMGLGACASYADGSDAHLTGREAYDRYSVVVRTLIEGVATDDPPTPNAPIRPPTAAPDAVTEATTSGGAPRRDGRHARHPSTVAMKRSKPPSSKEMSCSSARVDRPRARTRGACGATPRPGACSTSCLGVSCSPVRRCGRLAIPLKSANAALGELVAARILVEQGTVRPTRRGRPGRLYASAELLGVTGSSPLRA